MMRAIITLSFLICLAPPARAQSSADIVPVTVQNFTRAESDNYLAANAKEAGLGRLAHKREPASVENQTVIRLNRDTLYSFGIFDLAAAPVTGTLPDPGMGFMSLMIINEHHYVPYDTTPIRSITSPRRKAQMVLSPFSSAAATGRFRTACQSRQVGTTPCDCIARAPES